MCVIIVFSFATFDVIMVYLEHARILTRYRSGESPSSVYDHRLNYFYFHVTWCYLMGISDHITVYTLMRCRLCSAFIHKHEAAAIWIAIYANIHCTCFLILNTDVLVIYYLPYSCYWICLRHQHFIASIYSFILLTCNLKCAIYTVPD